MNQIFLKALCLAGVSFILSNCTTAPKETTQPEAPELSPRVSPQEPSTRSPSLGDLRRKVGLDRPMQALGYQERAFNTCRVGLSANSCQQKVFGQVQFQLLCRQSEGTVESVERSELTPVEADALKWKVGGISGEVELTSRGYGRVEFVAQSSKLREKLILLLDEQYLGIRLADVSRIVVPQTWCQ